MVLISRKDNCIGYSVAVRSYAIAEKDTAMEVRFYHKISETYATMVLVAIAETFYYVRSPYSPETACFYFTDWRIAE